MSKVENGVDLSRVEANDGIVFTGYHDDGRQVNVMVTIAERLGGYVYGQLTINEQVVNGNTGAKNDKRYHVRLPLDGVIEPGSLTLDISRYNLSHTDALKTDIWQELPVECESMEYYQVATPAQVRGTST